MYSLTLQYQATGTKLGQRRAELARPDGADPDAAVIAAIRYGALHVDVERMRARILDLYRDMAARDCANFDDEGLRLTEERFASLRIQERNVMKRYRLSASLAE